MVFEMSVSYLCEWRSSNRDPTADVEAVTQDTAGSIPQLSFNLRRDLESERWRRRENLPEALAGQLQPTI